MKRIVYFQRILLSYSLIVWCLHWISCCIIIENWLPLLVLNSQLYYAENLTINSFCQALELIHLYCTRQKMQELSNSQYMLWDLYFNALKIWIINLNVWSFHWHLLSWDHKACNVGSANWLNNSHSLMAKSIGFVTRLSDGERTGVVI